MAAGLDYEASQMGGQGIVLDVKSKLDRLKKPEGIDLWRL